MNEELLSKLKSYSIVSFDIFDTLVLRRVAEPRDVQLLMEQRLVREFGPDRYQGFARKRFDAELDLMKKVWSSDRSKEVTLDGIYENLYAFHPELHQQQINLPKMEIGFELKVCVPNERIKQVYERALDLGKRVIIVSDIYLPQQVIEDILSSCGYIGYDKLFVSNEFGCNKASGKLFDRVLEVLDEKPSEILHIGDSPNADEKQPRARGIAAIRIAKGADLPIIGRYKSKERDIHSSLFCGEMQNYFASLHQGTPYDIGYAILGPMCLAYSEWLARHAIAKNIEAIYFIAREGWFLKKVFQLYAEAYDIPVESHYFLGSRRSLTIPLLERETFCEDLCKVLISNKPMELSIYLELLGLELCDRDVRKFGYSSKNDIIDPGNSPEGKEKLVRFLEGFSEEIFALARAEKTAYLQYLEEIDFFDRTNIGLADSGWFGTGQSKLQKLVGERCSGHKLFGFYFAMHEKAKKRFNSESQGYGYLYHFDDLGGDLEEFLELARTIEVLLSAPSESIKRFIKKEGKVVPEFIVDNPNPQLDPTIEEIQRGAEDFAIASLSRERDLRIRPPQPLVRQMYMSFLRSPLKQEALHVGSIPYEKKVIDAGRPSMFAKESIHPIDALLKPKTFNRSLQRSNWRAAFYENLDSRFVKLLLRLTNRYFLEHTLLYRKARSLSKKIQGSIEIATRKRS